MRLNRHIVTTAADIEAPAITTVLAGAGIDASTSPVHLQGVSRLAARVLAGYPLEQRDGARATLERWIGRELAALDAPPGTTND